MTRRIGPAPPAEDAPARDLEARIMRSRGAISPLYGVLLHSLPVVEGWEALLTAIRQKTALDPALRELVILRIAILNDAPYEYDSHVPHALKAGLSETQIEAVRRDDRAPFTPLQALVLDYADAMTRDIRVADAVFQPIRDAFDDTGLVELTATIAAYNMVSRFLTALHVH
jgi:4-carboxymuconolactone decarboxylase